MFSRTPARSQTRHKTLATAVLVLGLSLTGLLAPTTCLARDWLIYTHSLDSQAELIDGQLRGREHAGKRAFFLELVRELLADMAEPLPIQEVPLARGLAQLQQRDDVVLFNLGKTPERLPLAHWVGPIWEETDWLYENTLHPTGIQSLHDAKSLPVCVLNSSSHDERLTALGFSQLKRNNAYSTCFGMLAAGRIALVASADSGLAQRLREAGVTADKVRPSAVQLGRDEGFIALSRSMPEQDIARWRAALQRVQQDGRFQALQNRYAH
ncbi:MAG: ABC transporter substrate-binding protein [Pseudomonas sp.]|nr:ABC transporter substrate-binding protein [Pseudomonas sp.]MDO9617745.1 ABC transporter substrate-binding protein [Pseudomonas sp.]MDP2445101.1 ABC transporter substrate-binding protein [Pseudomonas sp.]MDZ4334761.1 ABC transporter substrate-binding protein [Pseudomonas sp.]